MIHSRFLDHCFIQAGETNNINVYEAPIQSIPLQDGSIYNYAEIRGMYFPNYKKFGEIL